MQARPLGRATLRQLPPPLHLPSYDPGAVTPGIVHLGLGGFHRAHMARYTHALMARDAAHLRWGIIGAGLLPADRRMHDALVPQDGLYTLVERDAEGESAQVIGSLSGVIYAGEASASLLDAIDAVDLVSLTVTEHGYCLNRATKQLDPAHPLIQADLAAPTAPRSAIGIVAEACRRRMEAGRSPFTALSCDNIQHNGSVLRDAVLALARLRGEPALVDWIARHGCFPATMVDRITPVTTQGDIDHVADRYGVVDRWPVVCETFTQWVIEDRFTAARPPWEQVGAQMVADVAPYEMMKLRLLNASHLAVAGLGRLAGVETIDEAMRLPGMQAYMQALMDRETGPTVPEVPGIDLAAYQRSLVARFANPAIRDTVERVNTDAPLNVLCDPIRDRIEAGQDISLLGLALAAWLRRMRGEDEAGQPIEIRHPLAALLRERALAGGTDPRPMLAIAPLFGETGRDDRLIRQVEPWLASLYAHGSRLTLARVRPEVERHC